MLDSLQKVTHTLPCIPHLQLVTPSSLHIRAVARHGPGILTVSITRSSAIFEIKPIHTHLHIPIVADHDPFVFTASFLQGNRIVCKIDLLLDCTNQGATLILHYIRSKPPLMRLCTKKAPCMCTRQPHSPIHSALHHHCTSLLCSTMYYHLLSFTTMYNPVRRIFLHLDRKTIARNQCSIPEEASYDGTVLNFFILQRPSSVKTMPHRYSAIIATSRRYSATNYYKLLIQSDS